MKKWLSLTISSLLIATPVQAATYDLTVTGNGNHADSRIAVSQSQSVGVVQSNETEVNNSIVVMADTGDNSVRGTTGGDVAVETGEASFEVTLDNEVNSNAATVDAGQSADLTEVLIDGNGRDTTNRVTLTETSETGLIQSNEAEFNNEVLLGGETGENRVRNTTGGEVVIETGDVLMDVMIENDANGNQGEILAGEGGDEIGVQISENGVESDNRVTLEMDQSVGLVQDNETELNNEVGAEGQTGDNVIAGATGDSTTIETGEAEAQVTISNTAGFNAGDVGGEAVATEVTAKIDSNGRDSVNRISALFEAVKATVQTNSCARTGCFNNGSLMGLFTGSNKITSSTGSSGSDPVITTGKVSSKVSISNFGGMNTKGSLGLWWW